MSLLLLPGSSINFNRRPTETVISVAGDFTVEFWIYPTTLDVANIFKIKSNIYNGGLIIEYFDSKVRCQMIVSELGLGGMVDSALLDYTGDCGQNIWTHWAIVRLNNVVNIYKNGIPMLGTGVLILYIGQALSFSTTTSILTCGQGFNGNIQNLEFILSAKYNSNFTPITTLPAYINNYEFIISSVGSSVKLGGELAFSVLVQGTRKDYAVITSVNTSSLTPGSSPISTICFVAGTLVLTDQNGYVPIETLHDQYTLNGGKKILAVTETVTPEEHLALIKSGSIGESIPSMDTRMTLNHKIDYNGTLTEAYKLPSSIVSFIEYHGQTLYNVVLEEYGTMTVHNMRVETLDPENLLAKMFIIMKRVPRVDEKAILINSYNQYIQSKYVQTGMNTRNELEIVKN